MSSDLDVSGFPIITILCLLVAPMTITMGSNNSGFLVAPLITLTVIAIIAVIFRFWARKLRNTPPGLDDYLAVAALFMQGGVTAIAICAVVFGGLGQDVDVVLGEIEGGLEILLKVRLHPEITWE